jgi:hypothetical protein
MFHVVILITLSCWQYVCTHSIEEFEEKCIRLFCIRFNIAIVLCWTKRKQYHACETYFLGYPRNHTYFENVVLSCSELSSGLYCRVK